MKDLLIAKFKELDLELYNSLMSEDEEGNAIISYLIEYGDIVDIKYTNLNDENIASAYFDEDFYADEVNYLYNYQGIVFGDSIDDGLISEEDFNKLEDERCTIQNSIDSFCDLHDINSSDIQVKKCPREHGFFYKFEITSDKISGTFYRLADINDKDINNNHIINAIEQELGILNLKITFENKKKSGWDSYIPIEIEYDLPDKGGFLFTDSLYLNGLYQGREQNYLIIFEDDIKSLIEENIIECD